MKKKIIAVIAFVLVVTGVPFCAIKGDEAARARAKEAAESQNKEWYKEANACIDAGEYEDAIKLLEKLPTDYEDSRYIIPYAEYCSRSCSQCCRIYNIFQRGSVSCSN